MLGNAAAVIDGAILVKTATGASLRSDDPAFEAQLQAQLGRPISLHEDRSGDKDASFPITRSLRGVLEIPLSRRISMFEQEPSPLRSASE